MRLNDDDIAVGFTTPDEAAFITMEDVLCNGVSLAYIKHTRL